MLRFAVPALVAAAFLTAPQALADPDILTPNCTGGQVPEAGACMPSPTEPEVDDAPGPNPQVPLGLNPESEPAL